MKLTSGSQKLLLSSAFVWAVLIVVMASLPYIAGIAASPKDGVFTGFTFNLDDACVYSSWIRQVADGNVFFYNRFTSETQHSGQFNLFFLILGLLVKVTGISPAVMLHIARTILGVMLLLLIWRFSGRFIKDPVERGLVVPVVGLSGGLGWLLPGIGGHQGPVDLWQPEAITFLSIYLNPLFLIGMILMVASFYYLYVMKETGAWRDVVLAGIMLLLLGNIHTYDILTVAVVWTAYLAVKMLSEKRIMWKLIGQSAVAAAIAAPSVIFQFMLYRQEDVFRARVATPAPSPAFWAYLMGYGLLLVFAIIGGFAAVRQRRVALLLVVWAVVGFALPYLPVDQQRKLVMGLHIPIALLAVMGICAAARKFDVKISGSIAILFVTALVPSNILFMSKDIQRLGEGLTAPLYPAYLPKSYIKVFDWLRVNTEPSDTVLAPREIAVFVPALVGNQVYFGHWSETPGFGEKLIEWQAFVDGRADYEWQTEWLGRLRSLDTATSSDSWRRTLLERSKTRYIIYSANPAGQTVITGESEVPLFDLRKSDYAQIVFMSGDVAVYKIKDQL